MLRRVESRGGQRAANRRWRRAIAGAAAAVLGACSSGARPERAAVSPETNLITADEIAKSEARNAYDAILKLRPSMLGQGARRSSTSRPGVVRLVVYVDNTELGGADQLRQIPASSIAVVRYYSASEAHVRWGRGHLGGAVEVLTKR